MSTSTAGGAEVPLLVFGDDGSSAADVACLWIANHHWDKWNADVITAMLPTRATREQPAEFREWDSPHRRAILGGAGFANVHHLAIERDPRLMFDARANAGLIVIGDANERRFGPHLGSTAEWLVHHPPAPLAVIRSARRTHSALICVDGSGHAHSALRAFIALPFSIDTEVTVLHVDEGLGHRRAVDEAIDMLAAAGITPRLRSDSGLPARCIAEELRREPRELTVLGTRGRSGLNRILLGSTANAVVRSGQSSTLIATHDPEVGNE